LLLILPIYSGAPYNSCIENCHIITISMLADGEEESDEKSTNPHSDPNLDETKEEVEEGKSTFSLSESTNSEGKKKFT